MKKLVLFTVFMKTGCFLALVFLCAALPVAAVDFGLTLGQTGEYTNTAGDGSESHLNYTGLYSPWVSADLGETADIYLSAKLSTGYKAEAWKYGKPPLLFELGRSELRWRPAPSLYVEAGRVRFQDTSGFIASGLFDGLKGIAVPGKARLDAEVLYTGLQYKETAEIVMNSADADRYALPLDYTDPDSYLASRRLLFSAGAEFPDLSFRTTLKVNILAQFDLNPASLNGDDAFHSQYLTVRYSAAPGETLTVTGAAVAALAENQAGDTRAHFAAGAGIDWEAPGALQDMVQGELRWSSGAVNEQVGAFTPVNSITQGQVFTPRLSALITAKGKYTARLHRTVSASAEGTWFIRTDGETVSGTEYPPSASRVLGGELYGAVIWTPFSDIMVSAGGGAFFPQWGDVFESGAPVLWKITAGVVLSL